MGKTQKKQWTILYWMNYLCFLKSFHKIVVYGAEKVGQSFVTQNKNIGWFNLVAWIDSKKEGTINGISIQKPEVVNNMEFDYVLIAVSKQNEIRNRLLKNGIDNRVILWEEPVIDDLTWFFYYA